LWRFGGAIGRSRCCWCDAAWAERVDGTAFTVGIAPGVGPDGNADVFVGHFNSHMRVASLTNITHSDPWESSPRWGTAPLLP